MPIEDNGMDGTERWTRFGVNIGHGIFGTVLTAFGGGSAVQPIGEAENMALDAGFGKNKGVKVSYASQDQKASFINPGTDARQAAAETVKQKSQPSMQSDAETKRAMT